jgi:N-terminal acetyltransferase B complex catalytic subunit
MASSESFLLPSRGTHSFIPVLGKAEGSPHDFHGHVTALTVAPEYRRLSLARILMNFLETVSDDVYGGLFVDLYVRCTNSIAMDLYEGLGYSVYRRVREYYGSFGLGPGGKDEEDAFGPFSLLFPQTVANPTLMYL